MWPDQHRWDYRLGRRSAAGTVSTGSAGSGRLSGTSGSVSVLCPRASTPTPTLALPLRSAKTRVEEPPRITVPVTGERIASVGSVTMSAAVCDPEHEALVRLELSRVRAALASMNDRQRSILLSEVGEATLVDVSTPALKMARMRARRRLRSLIEGASGYAAFSAGKLRRWIQEIDVGFANAAASIAVQVTAVLAVGATFLGANQSVVAVPSAVA